MQTGNLTVLQQEKKKLEEKYVRTGRNSLKTPPKWLVGEIAKKEYKRIVKELEKIEIIGNLDVNNLGGYCNAFENYIKVTEQLKGEAFEVEQMTKFGPKMVANPLISVQTTYATEMRRFAALCGMTIDSRLKAADGKINEEQRKIESEFGL